VQNAYHLFETSIGACAIAWGPSGLTRVRLPSKSRDETEAQIGRHARAWEKPEALPDTAATAVRAITAYMQGARVDFRDARLDWACVPAFNARIYRVLAEVPFGETTTYGALAKAVGEPGAARAVGVAMGRNPWPIVIPCHRVLASGRQLGGFSAPGGVDTKIVLLRLEGSLPGDDAPMLPGLLD
jgi:methylated-DNA-[protein]-cysteine S-methyltransferase